MVPAAGEPYPLFIASLTWAHHVHIHLRDLPTLCQRTSLVLRRKALQLHVPKHCPVTTTLSLPTKRCGSVKIVPMSCRTLPVCSWRRSRR